MKKQIRNALLVVAALLLVVLFYFLPNIQAALVDKKTFGQSEDLSLNPVEISVEATQTTLEKLKIINNHILSVAVRPSSRTVDGRDVEKTAKKQTNLLLKKMKIAYRVDEDWKITYKNDKLGEMSTGKASFVILMLIIGLSKSKSPILIDQPEDNLDNRSITRDLVYYLKNKKLERQIIVVTHNANIVVNSDAENVIVANQKGQNNSESSSEFQFDYINGAIENTSPIDESETDLLKSMGIREHVAEIVEGGKEAFILRERKYRFEKNKS